MQYADEPKNAVKMNLTTKSRIDIRQAPIKAKRY
jgi:hypothetical protein